MCCGYSCLVGGSLMYITEESIFYYIRKLYNHSKHSCTYTLWISGANLTGLFSYLFFFILVNNAVFHSDYFKFNFHILFFLGVSDDREGLFDTIQRSKSHSHKRGYQCIKCIVQLTQKYV